MDISSQYYLLIKYPKRFFKKHLWDFLLAIHKVGKTTELISFVVWEIKHRFLIYKFSNRYIKFTPHKCASLENENLRGDIITSSFMAEEEVHLRIVEVDWKFCFQSVNRGLWGTRYSHINALYVSWDGSISATLVFDFEYEIQSLFVSTDNLIFVCVKGEIYRSENEGLTFDRVLKLSTEKSYFLYNNGVAEIQNCTLFIGEYASIWLGKEWKKLAFLYYSYDKGITWEVSDFLIRQGVNKHIHLVKFSKILNALILTDGDNKKQLWINRDLLQYDTIESKLDKGWSLLSRYHIQTGGYTSMAETEDTVLFGSDYLGGTNFIISTNDGLKYKKLVMPDPYRRSPIMNMISRQTNSGEEIWASSYCCLSEDARSLLMCTKDSGKTWIRILDVDGSKNEIRLVSSATGYQKDIYISITTFGETQNLHSYRTYKLEDIKFDDGVI